MSEREAVAVAILNYNVKHGTALGLLSSDDAYSIADTVLAALAARLPNREALHLLIYDGVEADIETEAQATSAYQEGYSVGFNDARYRIEEAVAKLLGLSARQ